VDFDESYFLLDNSVDSMNTIIEEKIKEIFKPEDSHEESLPATQETMDNRVAGLKKQEGQNSNKRPKGWVESMQDKAKKEEKKQTKSTQGKSNKTRKSGKKRKVKVMKYNTTIIM
jgi:hypothetical protein